MQTFQVWHATEGTDGEYGDLTQCIGEGVLFSDDSAVVRWLVGPPRTILFHAQGRQGIEALKRNGRNRIEWMGDI